MTTRICKLSLRLMCIGMTCFSCLLGGLCYCGRDQKCAEDIVIKHRGFVAYEYEHMGCLRNYVPDSICGRLCMVSIFGSPLSENELHIVCTLSHLKHLSLCDDTVINDPITEIAMWPKLETLLLSNNAAISDRTFPDKLICPELEVLWVDHTSIGDRGIQWLRHSKRLRRVDLSATKVSAEGVLRALGNLPALERINLTDTPVCNEDLEMLRARMPKVLIEGGDTS